MFGARAMYKDGWWAASRPDRVVIGTDDDEATAILKSLYRPLYLIETPIVLTNTLSVPRAADAVIDYIESRLSESTIHRRMMER